MQIYHYIHNIDGDKNVLTFDISRIVSETRKLKVEKSDNSNKYTYIYQCEQSDGSFIENYKVSFNINLQ